jgi:hypothetical protein
VADVITPAEAFWLMLAARYDKAALKVAEGINLYDWFWHPKSSHIKVRKGKGKGLAKIPLSVHAAAERTLKLFCDHVREGDIGLRGELNNNPPIDIDRADSLIGKLDIFQQTLTIYRGRTPARTYHNVICVKDGVMKIVENISKNRPGLAQREWPPIQSKALKLAPPSVIRAEIKSVYDDADKDKSAPRPNILQLPNVVKPRLENLGYKGQSDAEIKRIGKEDQFVGRRNKRGKRLNLA